MTAVLLSAPNSSIPSHNQLELADDQLDKGGNRLALIDVLPFPQMGDLTQERRTKTYFIGASNTRLIFDAIKYLMELETEYFSATSGF